MMDPTIKCFEELKSMFKDGLSTQDDNPCVWLKLIRNKLYTMFQCPLKEEYNREAFKWVANLCITSGDFSWLCSCDKWTNEEAKIFSLIARLSTTEMIILLPVIQRNLTCGEEPEFEEGKIMARSASSIDYDYFGNHLMIMESTIKSLVKGQDDDDSQSHCSLADCMTTEELKSLLQRLKEVISEICDYLEIVHSHWSQLIVQIESEKFLAAEGGLRIMSVWLSEEPFGFESQCKRFLIDLILKNLLLLERPAQHDLMILALHSVCTQNEELMLELKKNSNYLEALQKYLNFVQREQDESDQQGGESSSKNVKRQNKMFKLRCGLVKDLLRTS